VHHCTPGRQVRAGRGDPGGPHDHPRRDADWFLPVLVLVLRDHGFRAASSTVRTTHFGGHCVLDTGEAGLETVVVAKPATPFVFGRAEPVRRPTLLLRWCWTLTGRRCRGSVSDSGGCHR